LPIPNPEEFDDQAGINAALQASVAVDYGYATDQLQRKEQL